MDAQQNLIKCIQRQLHEQRLSVRKATLKFGFPARSLQSVLEGHQPSISRVAEICEALGIEFYIGPPRSENTAPQPDPQPADTPKTHPLPTAQKSVLKEKEYRNSPGPGTALAPVRDKNLARLLAWIIDEWAALNDRGRTRFTSRFRREFTEFDGE